MSAFLGVLLLALTSLAGCNSFLFYPEKEHFANPHLQRVAHEDIFFAAPDGPRLHGWLLRPAGIPRGTLLFLHGNAENISTHVNSVLWLALEGYQIFLFDYRGYGKSEGRPTLDGVHADAMAALDTVLTLPGVEKDRIVVLGQSLGGAVSVYTVANSPRRDRVKALIIDSSFDGYRNIAKEKIASLVFTWPLSYPAALLFDDRYSPLRWIDRISPIPVIVIHGTADRVVPFPHGERLYRQAKEPKGFWIARGRGHIEALAEESLRKQLLLFLSDVPGNGK